MLGRLFTKFKQGLTKTISVFTGVVDLFTGNHRVDKEFLAKLEEQLLLADVGIGATSLIVEKVRKGYQDREVGEDVKLFQRAVRRAPIRQQRGVLGASPLLRPLLEASVAEPQAMPEGLVARYLAPYVGREGVDQLHTIMRSLRAQDLHEEELRSVAAPTLIVAGDRDRWLDLKTAERLAGTIPEARLERVAGAGRLIPEEAPDELTELILRFDEGH